MRADLALKTKRSLGEKSCRVLFSPTLRGVKALLHSPSAPVTPQQTSSFATKESVTPATAVRLRLKIE